MTAPAAYLADEASSNPKRSRIQNDAMDVTLKETTPWKWIRRAWHYIADRPLV